MCKDNYSVSACKWPFLSSSSLSPLPAWLCLAHAVDKNQLRFVCCVNGQPYTVLIDSGATSSFIRKSLVTSSGRYIMPLASPLLIYAFDSAMEPCCLLTEGTTWLFDLPNFHRLKWPVLVVDSTNMDNTVLGYDFLWHWNPIINWHEGLITSCTNPPLNSNALISVKLDLSNPTQHPEESSRPPSLPSDLQALENPSFSFKSINVPLTPDALFCTLTIGKPYKPFEADFFDESPEVLETVLPLIPNDFQKFAHLFSKLKADELPPQKAFNHQIELTGDPLQKGGV